MLHELQQQFFEGLFTANESIADQLLPSDTLSTSERLAIYRSSVHGIHTTALGEIYPVCKRLVGTKFFEAMCDRYIPAHVSNSPNLQDYGGTFAAFIADFKPAQTLPYLPDVARLEWAWHNAFHAVDETGLDTTSLEGLADEEKPHIVFRLPVSGTLLSSRYPIHRIWEINQPDYPGEESVSLADGAVRLLVWRQAYAMRIDLVDDDSWPLLEALVNETPLGELPERLPQQDVSILLPQCVQRGWIAGYTLKE